MNVVATMTFTPAPIDFELDSVSASAPPQKVTVSGGGGTLLSAVYAEQDQLTISVSPSTSGTVSVSRASPGGYYDHGSTVTHTATPNTGFSFLSYLGSGTFATTPVAKIAITSLRPWSQPSCRSRSEANETQ